MQCNAKVKLQSIITQTLTLRETAASFRNNTEKFYTGTVPTTGWILSSAIFSWMKALFSYGF